jgi:hypothetical protein
MRPICFALLIAAVAGPAAAQSFTPTASLHIARAEHAAVVLADGRVLVGGGVGDDGRAIAAAEIFDPGAAPGPRPRRIALPASVTRRCPCPTAASSSSAAPRCCLAPPRSLEGTAVRQIGPRSGSKPDTTTRRLFARVV